MIYGIPLKYEGVSKSYRSGIRGTRVTALNSVSLQMQQGEILGFLGPNGAGKTTAIHLALGLIRPSEGTGELLGRPFGNVAARACVGFVPENPALYNRTVASLFDFYGALYGMRQHQLRFRCAKVLRDVGLEEETSRKAGQLSRGMQQRIGLAQALANDPRLLILDEPTSALDPRSRAAVRELLLELNRAGKSIFLSSHLLSEVELLCHRIAVLDHGNLVAFGRTSELLAQGTDCKIVARGIPADAFPSSALHDGVITIIVPASAQRRTVQQIWTLGGEVVSVNPVRRSLEEVFLQLTQPKDVQ